MNLMTNTRTRTRTTGSTRTRCARWWALALCATIPLMAVTPPATAQNKSKPKASSGLSQRIEQLEEQIVDMQVVIGTLQSLPRDARMTTPSTPAAGGFNPTGASDSARLDGMETQIRALSSQLTQLSRQVNALSANRRGDATTGFPSPQATAPVAPAPPQSGATAAIPEFGSTTVVPENGDSPDPISGYLQPADAARPVATRSTAAGGTGDPKKLYETAYGYLLQQDYAAAESAFSDFLQRHPNDALAGNAQYWLGESHYVRGRFKTAASAFLKGYETYGTSAKAPDSLLKLGMSLDRLGQKDAACSSLSELLTRFPRAPAHIKNRAASERRRVGC